MSQATPTDLQTEPRSSAERENKDARPVGESGGQAGNEGVSQPDQVKGAEGWQETLVDWRPTPHLPHVFSRLGMRVLLLNLLLVAAMSVAFFVMDRSRDQLIQSRIEAMTVQAELIASSFAGETVVGEESIDISQDKANQMMKLMVVPTDVRARVYNRTGRLLSDSRLFDKGQVEVFDLAPIGEDKNWFRPMEGLYDLWVRVFGKSKYPQYTEYTNQPGTEYEEVVAALDGATTSMVRVDSDDDLFVTVATPIKRFKIVLGVLLVSNESGDIDALIRENRIKTLRIFSYGLLAMMIASLLVSFYIVRPVRRLAEAADQAVQGTNFVRVEIPDHSKRNDEIGDLSTSFRRMVRALYTRIEAIESFAADVSHEIKNPLTSIRSAVETLGFVKDEKARDKLLNLIVQDVGRLDRLISDISDASRLDAELVREKSQPVDMDRFLEGLIQIYESTRKDNTPDVHLVVEPLRRGQGGSYVVMGLEGRLGQVFRNIINNAVSFSQPDDVIEVRLSHRRFKGMSMVEVTIDDQGPGIPEDNLTTIFNRFYTERPESEGFGGNSGLGLSISKQIIEMFDGAIWAENLTAADGSVAGARFVVLLPMVRAEEAGA